VEEELMKDFDDIIVEVVEGEFGQFEITVDDALVFSKEGCGDRFPFKGEISGIIRQRKDSG
jgi:hypothetical protein